MTWSLTELGGDILLFERLLDSALCSHILEIVEVLPVSASWN